MQREHKWAVWLEVVVTKEEAGFAAGVMGKVMSVMSNSPIVQRVFCLECESDWRSHERTEECPGMEPGRGPPYDAATATGMYDHD